MRFIFRADGNSKIGLGHITRCLALAYELKKYGDVEFISKQLPIKIPFKMHKLPRGVNYNDDIKLTRCLLRKLVPDVVIVDHHRLGQDYLNDIKAFTNLLVTIDDLNREICSDVVVNVNSFSLRMKYKCDKGRVFLGPKYALVKRVVARKSLRVSARKVLVSMGGADVLNITPKVVSALKNVEGFHATVVIGPAFTNKKEIIAAISDDRRFSVVWTNNLSGLMLKHDIAVCGGGTTLYELAATGTPAIIICQAENQFINASELHGKMLVNLGMGNKVRVESIIDSLTSLIKDYDLRKFFSLNGKRLVDCKGPRRVAKIILSELEKRKIELRPAKRSDTLTIWKLRNEKLTRMNSFNSRFISLREHKKWFGQALKDKKKILLILNRRRLIGYVRLDSQELPELHVVIGKEYRGLGFGSRAIRLACAMIGGKVMARIKPSNIPSIRAFENAGFRIVEKSKEVITLVS